MCVREIKKKPAFTQTKSGTVRVICEKKMYNGNSIVASPTPSLTHSLPPSPSLPHSLPPSLTHSLTHSLPHSLTHSLTQCRQRWDSRLGPLCVEPCVCCRRRLFFASLFLFPRCFVLFVGFREGFPGRCWTGATLAGFLFFFFCFFLHFGLDRAFNTKKRGHGRRAM